MEERLEMIINNGFAIVMCLLIFFKMLPRLDKLDKSVIKDSENTEKVEKSIDILTDTINNHLVHTIDNLTAEIRRMNDKK